MPRSTNDAKLNGSTAPGAVDPEATASDAIDSEAAASPEGEAVAPADETVDEDDFSDGFENGEEASDDGPGETATAQGRRRFSTVWLTAAVVVGLLLGYAAGLLTPSLRAPGDNSPEAGFARDMSVHHTQAVEIAMIAYQRGSDDSEVRDLAYEIATGQENEKGYMRRWLEEWHLSPNSSRPRMAWMPEGTAALKNGLMPGMASDAEILKMRQAPEGRPVDILFAQYMLRHHLGGIHMIDGVLNQTDRPEVVQLATNMKTVQQREVDVLREMLTRFNAPQL